MMRSRSILLDANIVIELFRLGVWRAMVSRCEIMLAETVVAESRFHDTEDGRRDIDWAMERSRGEVRFASLPAGRIHAYVSRFGPGYFEKLDPGEAESLALLEAIDGSMICSADRIVWRVLGNTDRVDRGISLEELLRGNGLQKPLHARFSRAFRERWCREGVRERLMGRGDRSGEP